MIISTDVHARPDQVYADDLPEVAEYLQELGLIVLGVSAALIALIVVVVLGNWLL